MCGTALCTCLFIALGIANTVIQILAVVASSKVDGVAMIASPDKAVTYYQTLPIISIVIPNPITAGMTAFTDCEEFNNCDENYRDLYTAAFALSIVSVFSMCCMCCCFCCAMCSDDEKNSADARRRIRAQQRAN